MFVLVDFCKGGALFDVLHVLDEHVSSLLRRDFDLPSHVS